MTNAPPREVFARARRFRKAQLILEKPAGALVHFQQRGSDLRFAGFFWAAEGLFGQRDTELLCDRAHRFRKGDVLELLHEAEDVTRSSATKAMKELPHGMYGKRRRLFLMEWA